MDCCWAPRLIRRVQYCFNGWWHQVLMWNIFFIPINVCKWIILFHRIYNLLKMITEIWRKKMNLFRIFKRLCTTIDHNKCVNFPFKNALKSKDSSRIFGGVMCQYRCCWILLHCQWNSAHIIHFNVSAS